MTETKSHTSHVFDRMVAAEIEDVWRALTDPDERQESHFDNVVESSWMPGEPVRFRDSDGELVIEGTVVDVDAPHRLVHTFAFTKHAAPEAAGDPPSQVTWTMEPDDEGTRVTLVHDGFATRNASWRAAEDGWDQVLDSLVGLFESDDEE